MEDAKKLGATHLKEVPENTHQQSTYRCIHTAIAYLCPVPAPSPVK